MKKLCKNGVFAIRLLDRGLGGTRRGSLADAKGNQRVRRKEPFSKRPKVLKDAIERAGY